MSEAQVAVVGGGISGCLTACQLADAAIDVVIIEKLPEVMGGASRWNDGKIHLGYTFTGTSSLATARLMQEGAACFLPVLEGVLGRAIPDSWFGDAVTYIVDRDSLFDVETLWPRAQAVAGLLTGSLDQWPDLRRWVNDPLLERLGLDRAGIETGQDRIVAAWRTSERHVSARMVADLVRQAVRERGITVIRGEVESIAAVDRGWSLRQADGTELAARVVVNSAWENRARLDRSVDPEQSAVSIRYKRALFGRNAGLADMAASTRILGRFGDVISYANGDAYLSWYPAGLAGRSDDGSPPHVPDADRERLVRGTLEGLGLASAVLERPGAEWVVGGGYVVAHGHGDIDQRHSPLHERDRPAVRELRPGFVSVDTGKYTLGPLMSVLATATATKALGRSALPSFR